MHVLCTGNTIKTVAGDTPCDTACDGVRTVANQNHTACGASFTFCCQKDFHFRLLTLLILTKLSKSKNQVVHARLVQKHLLDC